MAAIYKKHHLLHTDMSANTRMGSGLVMAPITTRMEDLLLVRINHQPVVAMVTTIILMAMILILITI